MEKDWRLTNQENYLKGVSLVHRKYRQYPENPKWDHDHCAFCWAEFSLREAPEALKEGYTTENEYHWVCEKCFADFKDSFQWQVREENPEIT